MSETDIDLEKSALQAIHLVLSAPRIVEDLLTQKLLDSKQDPELPIERLDHVDRLRSKFSEEQWLQSDSPTESANYRPVRLADKELAAVRRALTQFTKGDLQSAYFGPGIANLSEGQQAHVDKLFTDLEPAMKAFRVPTPIKR